MSDTELRSQSAARQKIDEVYDETRFEADRQEVVIALNGAVLVCVQSRAVQRGDVLLVGALYHKTHTRDLRRYGGLWTSSRCSARC